MITLFIDGAGWNGRISECAFCVYEGDTMLHEEHKSFLKQYTNNQMEYSGLIYGLLHLAENYNIKTTERIAVRTDSQLVCNQMNKLWRVKDIVLVRAVANATEILNRIRINRPINIEWTRRDKNRAGKYLEQLQRERKHKR